MKSKALAFPFINKEKYFGWIPNDGCGEPSVYKVGNLKDYGKNKVVCLWKAWNAVNGIWKPRSQQGPDCVANASGSAIDVATCVQMLWRNKAHLYLADSSTDMIYSGCRNIIGVEEIGHKTSAGAFGNWAVKYLQRYGNLFRINYTDFNIDLTPYTSSTMRYWDDNGVPSVLLTEAKKHPLLSWAPVLSWEEVRDAVSAGNPVIFTGMLSFENSKRDAEGFCKPQGRNWPHAWMCHGVKDDGRPGACLQNSWGNWASGPKTHGQPDGSIWVDAEYIDDEVKRFGDSTSVNVYRGFQRPEKDYRLW
jgi:hypothetical protein